MPLSTAPNTRWRRPDERRRPPPLARPRFLAIVSSDIVAKTMLRRGSGAVEGFVVEDYTAGGHNAPPRRRGGAGDVPTPGFSEADAPRLEGVRALGLPFWVAGSCASPERLVAAQAQLAQAQATPVPARLRWSVIPQAFPEIASFVLYRFEINIRVSTVLGAVGAGGIGQVVDDALTTAIPKDWGLAGMALIIVIVATVAVDTVSGAVRRRILAGPS